MIENNQGTSDGIRAEDWEGVIDFSAQIANAVISEDEILAETLTKKLLGLIDVLERKYGKLPSILATRADCMDDPVERGILLEQAWQIASELADKANLVLISSSLAELYIEELGNLSMGKKWLASLADALGDKWDDLEHQEFQKLSVQLEGLKRKKKP